MDKILIRILLVWCAATLFGPLIIGCPGAQILPEKPGVIFYGEESPTGVYVCAYKVEGVTDGEDAECIAFERWFEKYTAGQNVNRL